MESAFWNEHYDVRIPLDAKLTRADHVSRYYIIYVFQGAGLTGRRGNLIADSVQYVLNVVFTSMFLNLRS